MFFLSFCVLSGLRLAYRHTACLGLASLALSLWAWWQAHVFYRWLGPAPEPDPKEFAAWMAAAAWAITLLGSNRRYWCFLVPLALVSSQPTLNSLAGLLTGMAVCLKPPQHRPDDFGLTRT